MATIHGQRDRGPGRAPAAGSADDTDDSGVLVGVSDGGGGEPGSAVLTASAESSGMEMAPLTSIGIDSDSGVAHGAIEPPAPPPSRRSAVFRTARRPDDSVDLRAIVGRLIGARHDDLGRLRRRPRGEVRRWVRRARAELARLDDGRRVRGAMAQLGSAIAELAHDCVGQRRRDEVLLAAARRAAAARSDRRGGCEDEARREKRARAERSAGSGRGDVRVDRRCEDFFAGVRIHGGHRAASRQVPEDVLEERRIDFAAEEHRAR